MKKNLLISLFTALAVTLILFGIETIGALTENELPISYEIPGGDCSVEQGIGWKILHLFPLYTITEIPTGSTLFVNFDFLSLAVFFSVLWFVLFIIICLVNRKFKKLLIILGCILSAVVIYLIVVNVIEAIKNTPTELTSLRVHTADMNPGSCYTVAFPSKAFYFIPRGKSAQYNQPDSKKLDLKDDEEKVTGRQLSCLLDAARHVKAKATVKGNVEDFAFRVEIVYKTVDGYDSFKFTGYEDFPENWGDFVRQVNDICKGDYLSETPQVVRFSKEWFMDNFGISEAGMPAGGSLDGFIENRKINMKLISGINSGGNLEKFNINTELRDYATIFTRVDSSFLQEHVAKEIRNVHSTSAEFREFAYAYAEKMGCKDDAEYSVLSDSGADYVKFTYEMSIIYVFRSENFTPIAEENGYFSSPELRGISGDGTAPIYYDASGKYVLVTQSSASEVYEVFFAMETEESESDGESGEQDMNMENDKIQSTLDSLKTEEPIDMYSMTYFNSCYYDEYLDEGYTGTENWISFVTGKFVGSPDGYPAIKNNSCSAFVCRNEKNEVLYCRNFDIEEISPCCMLTTTGEDGYKSIGGTDISILYNAETGKMELEQPNNLAALVLPYRTHDGMNEHGVAVSILRTGRAKTATGNDKKMLSVLDVVRIVLEKAKNIDDAIEILNQYNVDFGPVYDNSPFHYFIADASGRSVVVEYGDGTPTVVESSYVTNFNLEGNRNGVGQDRYDTIAKTLDEHGQILNETQAMELLADVVMKGLERYSVVYNLTTGEVTAFSHADPSVTACFKLEMKTDF